MEMATSWCRSDRARVRSRIARKSPCARSRRPTHAKIRSAALQAQRKFSRGRSLQRPCCARDRSRNENQLLYFVVVGAGVLSVPPAPGAGSDFFSGSRGFAFDFSLLFSAVIAARALSARSPDDERYASET